ncbi:MAG: tRNA/helicase-type nucleic acid binding protein, partial [Elusimicrobia bacterium]
LAGSPARPAGHAAKTAAPPALPPLAKAAPRPKGAPTELSVADVHKRGKELAGKLVAVRGKVVKTNANILGKNWFHLQDGTGDAKAGTNDLTLTSSGSAAKGDMVRAVGVLAADKDLGSGYAYKVILEDAELTPAK